MEKFAIGVVQMNALRNKLDHNLEVHSQFVKEAAVAGCQIVMFPELSVTAHFGDSDVTTFGEVASPGNRIYEHMRSLAANHNIIVAYGFCERVQGTFFNSYALMHGDGLMGVQRKVHASMDEYYSFRMGRHFELFDLGFCRIGVLVCADANYFEAWRVMALKDAELLLLPHAGRSGHGIEVPADEQQQHLTDIIEKLPGRYGIYAADNNLYAAYGNQVGYNGHSTHSGGAYVCGPDGKLVCASEPCLGDLLITAELDPALLEAERNSKYSLLRTRRPETYQEVTQLM